MHMKSPGQGGNKFWPSQRTQLFYLCSHEICNSSEFAELWCLYYPEATTEMVVAKSACFLRGNDSHRSCLSFIARSSRFRLARMARNAKGNSFPERLDLKEVDKPIHKSQLLQSIIRGISRRLCSHMARELTNLVLRNLTLIPHSFCPNDRSPRDLFEYIPIPAPRP
jgi:hypothetical protein